MTVDQRRECERQRVEPLLPAPEEQFGWAARAAGSSKLVNGLRHEPEGDACGWYIWMGREMSRDPEFFEARSVGELEACCPEAVRFLALPPGWRFMTDGVYVDVWFDPRLLERR